MIFNPEGVAERLRIIIPIASCLAHPSGADFLYVPFHGVVVAMFLDPVLMSEIPSGFSG
jgi:hypothetical protein